MYVYVYTHYIYMHPIYIYIYICTLFYPLLLKTLKAGKLCIIFDSSDALLFTSGPFMQCIFQ
jgi:hypothetical protein